jgi:hypothetical protein
MLRDFSIGLPPLLGLCVSLLITPVFPPCSARTPLETAAVEGEGVRSRSQMSSLLPMHGKPVADEAGAEPSHPAHHLDLGARSLDYRPLAELLSFPSGHGKQPFRLNFKLDTPLPGIE